MARSLITLEDAGGRTIPAGIDQTLRRAHEVTAIHDPSPLVVVGIYRLLPAVLQDALNPTRPSDLQNLWRQDRFPDEPLSAFGRRYAGRFDLFSPGPAFLRKRRSAASGHEGRCDQDGRLSGA
ncbi:MAG: type I-E CRISPR-associated protein Cse1/CasA [Anaerolineae bacterium]|nr:type I-E CRISPR-associated protein Cse1/CasA [Anaerolineae bacterium]